MITADEREFYQGLWKQQQVVNELLPGSLAAPFLAKSRVDQEKLRKIWNLSDVDEDGSLTLNEFCIAMHLCICVSKRGLKLPSTLPSELRSLETQHSQLSLQSSQDSPLDPLQTNSDDTHTDAAMHNETNALQQMHLNVDSVRSHVHQTTTDCSQQISALQERRNHLMQSLQVKIELLATETRNLETLEHQMKAVRTEVVGLERKNESTQQETLDAREKALSARIQHQDAISSVPQRPAPSLNEPPREDEWLGSGTAWNDEFADAFPSSS